jgi:sorting nexin-9/18/33
MHINAVSRSIQGLRSIFTKVRESRLDMAKTERGLGYALLGMITRPRESEEMHKGEEEDECDRDIYSGWGVVNKDGAWCWRENCKGIGLFPRLLDKLASY